MKRISVLLSFLFVLPSCTERMEYLEAEILRLKEQIASQNTAISALQTALSSGRRISEFKRDENGNGFSLTFVDGETVRIADGKTPLISIGENGNWFLDEVDTGKPSRGATPVVKIVEGCWWVDDVNTGVKAEAKDGLSAPNIVSIVDARGYMSFVFSDGSVIQVDKVLKRLPITSEFASGLVGPGEKLILGGTYIRKNSLITVEIDFDAVECVRIYRGAGKEFNSAWMDIDKEYVKVYRSREDNLVKSISHGLTPKGKLNVSIDYGDGSDAQASVSMMANGQVFDFQVVWYGGGEPAIENKGSKAVEATIRFFPQDASSKVWVIGDSYIDWINPERWPYYIFNMGHKSWLADHLSGSNSRQMLASFKNDIKFGTPDYVCWFMGMNDPNDGVEAPAETWLACVKEFISICEENGITPILATIPSVPSHNHSEKARWVRDSGYRYIDMAKAVLKDEASSEWNDGLLSTDNIHPSVAGAKALALKVLADFPEISVK